MHFTKSSPAASSSSDLVIPCSSAASKQRNANCIASVLSLGWATAWTFSFTQLSRKALACSMLITFSTFSFGHKSCTWWLEQSTTTVNLTIDHRMRRETNRLTFSRCDECLTAVPHTILPEIADQGLHSRSTKWLNVRLLLQRR